LAIDDIDGLLFADEAPTDQQALRVLTDAFAAATDTPDGPLLLALYVHGLCLEKWESAVRSDIVGRFVRRYYQAAEGARAPYDSELADLLALIEQDSSIPLLPVGELDRVPLLAGG
jgi:hypothetical protein